MKKLLTNENGSDGLKPQSTVFEPQGKVAADAQGRNDTPEYSKGWDGPTPRSSNELTKYMISQLDKPPYNPNADLNNGSRGYQTFADIKRQAADELARRVGLEKDGLSGQDKIGATDFDEKGDLRAKNQGYERRGY